MDDGNRDLKVDYSEITFYQLYASHDIKSLVKQYLRADDKRDNKDEYVNKLTDLVRAEVGKIDSQINSNLKRKRYEKD